MIGKASIEEQKDWDKADNYIDVNTEAAGAPHIKFLKA
jgi:hypothetical protein